MRVLLWHVHGSWTTALVQGDHDYLVPVTPDRGPDGRGRAQTWDWPASVSELTPQELRDAAFDVVLLQRPHELEELCEAWTGRRPGRDVPAVYVEHNAPQGAISEMRHPAADRDDLTVAHVTHFNALFWDTGSTASRVIEHGIVDPGHRYSGELSRAAVVINEARRRARVTGTDLLERFAAAAPLDLFGMDAEKVAWPARNGASRSPQSRWSRSHGDVPQARMHDELALRRVYLHPIRWTSLGLSLLEAMHLGMPVVALATTEATEAIPAGAGVTSTHVDALVDALRGYMADPERARAAGVAAREAALERYGLGRFLADWDALLEEVA
ncbi:MAG TPA: glycosyltransferase [Solirubrobacteraceae bacterium]|nr:glycosyltransferase [Solirubrobacteraceae bacterium]